MADYSYRDIVTHRREFTVPVRSPWGADWGEINKALCAAEQFYREQRNLDPTVATPGDFARFFPGDDEVVIAVTVESPTRP